MSWIEVAAIAALIWALPITPAVIGVLALFKLMHMRRNKVKPKTPEEVKDIVNKAGAEGNIMIAPTDETMRLAAYVREIVFHCDKARVEVGERGFGNRMPFVSDLSAISDFAPTDSDRKEEYFILVEEGLGLTIERGNSLIVDIAKRMMN